VKFGRVHQKQMLPMVKH